MQKERGGGGAAEIELANSELVKRLHVMVRHAAAAGGSVPASPGCGCSAISSFCFHEQDSRSERVTMVQSILQINHMLRKWIDGSGGELACACDAQGLTVDGWPRRSVPREGRDG